ncbi:MAG: hypothetical protein R2766_12715 [Saprospiraceae bacterium]
MGRQHRSCARQGNHRYRIDSKRFRNCRKKLDKYKKSAKGGDKKELHKVELNVEKVLKHLEWMVEMPEDGSKGGRSRSV